MQNGRYDSGIWNTCNGVSENHRSTGSREVWNKMPGILKTKSQDVYSEMLYASENNKLEMNGSKMTVYGTKSSLKGSSSNKKMKVPQHVAVGTPATNCKL